MMIRRFLSLKVIALAAMLVTVALVYFAARKIMVSDVELGMSRAEVIKVLGEPAEKVPFFYPGSEGEGWQSIVFSKDIFSQAIVVAYDENNKVNLIVIFTHVLGRHFQQIKQ